MRFITAYAWRQGERNALVLQQLQRKKGRLPILFAGICEEGKTAEQWEDWFQEKALPVCRRGEEEQIAEKVQVQFLEWLEKNMERREPTDGTGRNGYAGRTAFAVLFCAGRECFYAWRGDMDLRVLNMQFGRAQVRSLTRQVEGYGCERAFLEENVGLLLGTGGFYRSLSEETVRACLTAVDLNGQQQADRHLAELCEEAFRCGAESTAAILTVSKEGTA